MYTLINNILHLQNKILNEYATYLLSGLSRATQSKMPEM